MGPDMDATQREIAKFSVRDAENYPKYDAMLERVADVIEPTLLLAPPNLLRPGLKDLWDMFRLGRSMQKMGPGLSEAVEVLTGAARPILDRWFESEERQGDAGHRRRHRRHGGARACRARPTSCFTTSWARPTASAASGPTSRAAWAA